MKNGVQTAAARCVDEAGARATRCKGGDIIAIRSQGVLGGSMVRISALSAYLR